MFNLMRSGSRSDLMTATSSGGIPLTCVQVWTNDQGHYSSINTETQKVPRGEQNYNRERMWQECNHILCTAYTTKAEMGGDNAGIIYHRNTLALTFNMLGGLNVRLPRTFPNRRCFGP